MKMHALTCGNGWSRTSFTSRCRTEVFRRSTAKFLLHNPSRQFFQDDTVHCCTNNRRISYPTAEFGFDDPDLIRIREFKLPTQTESTVAGVGDAEYIGVAVKEKDKMKDVDYLAELIAIQQNGPKDIAFFKTRNMGFLHQQLIEILSYAMVLTGNHLYTSGATGTNAAVIRGALRAERADLLTVVLPQSLSKQPQESQELLVQVENIITMPQNDDLPLLEASRICNKDIISRVQQIICFAFHDSSLMLETCHEAKEMKKLVTLFYLD